MERSSTFTSVPGMGGVVMGVIALVAAVVGARQPTADRWLVTWLAAASAAVAVELLAMMRKAHRAGMTLTGAAARRFGWQPRCLPARRSHTNFGRCVTSR
jgi:hypothetical protein